MKNAIDPYRRSALRDSLAKWLTDEAFTHAVTLNINRDHDLSRRSITTFFKRFCHEVDRINLGKCRVHKVPTLERFHAIALPEKLESNPHLHLVADLGFLRNRGFADSEIERQIYRAWARATNGSGDVDVQRRYGKEWPWFDEPHRRSPSQWPGTARSSTEAGRSRIDTASTMLPR